MARTKQTARRSTGGKAPRKLKKARQREAARLSAMTQLETTTGGSEHESESSLSTAQSMEPPEPVPGSMRNGAFDQPRDDDASIPLGSINGIDKDEEEEWHEDEDEESMPALMDRGQSSLTMSSNAVSNIDQTHYGHRRKIDADFWGDAVDDVVEVGHLFSTIDTTTVPRATLDSSLGIWLSEEVFHDKGSSWQDSTAVYDSDSNLFGNLKTSHSSRLHALLDDADSTKFRYELHLKPRFHLPGEDIGASSDRTVHVDIVVYAALHSCPDILEEFGTDEDDAEDEEDGEDGEEREDRWRLHGSANESEEDILLKRSAQEFQKEAASRKASSRVEQEKESEMRHSPKRRSAAAMTEGIDVGTGHSKPTSDTRDANRSPSPVNLLPASASTEDTNMDAVEDQPRIATITETAEPQRDEQIATGQLTIRADNIEAVASIVSAFTPVTEPDQTLRSLLIPLQLQQGEVLRQATPADAEGEPMSAQAVPAEVQQSTAVMSVTEQDLQDFLEDTESTSIEDARQYLTAAGCSLRQAVKRYHKDQKAVLVAQKETPPPVKEPAALTLLEQALNAPIAIRKERQILGDTVVILDGVNLGRNCRLPSFDLREALPVLEAEPALLLDDDKSKEVQGVRRLYILLQSINGEMPKLKRMGLFTLREDCNGEIFTLPFTQQSIESNTDLVSKSSSKDPSEQEQSGGTNVAAVAESNPLGQAVQVSPQQTTPQPQMQTIDWQSGYEDFFCTLTPFKPKYFNAKELTSIIPKLEAVAEIADHYGAVKPDSLVTDSMTDLFNRFQLRKQLWEAIAQDAARWLMLALHLKQAHIYKEAFVHVAGNFPNWPWSVSKSAFPTAVQDSIEIKSCQLHEERRRIDRKLNFLTIPTLEDPDDLDSPLLPVSSNSNATTWYLVGIWTDWIRSHLAALEYDIDGNSANLLPSELCAHPEGGECLRLAGFYRRVHEGNDAYLPIEMLLRNWNRRAFKDDQGRNVKDWEESVKADLTSLKDSASELVAPLTKKSLHFQGRLDYLTCVEFEEEDLPWEKGARGVEDEVMG